MHSISKSRFLVGGYIDTGLFIGADSAEVLELSTVSGWFSGFEDAGSQATVEEALAAAIVPSWTIFKCSWAGE